MANCSYRGVDMGWLVSMENAGVIFRDFDGKPIEMFSLLKTLGVNAVRQRVWVNPDDTWGSGQCDIRRCVEMGRRTVGAGMEYMVDFHYSNSWADPTQQRTPKEWENDTLEELCRHTYEHTRECLEALRDAGIQPKWVQTGNETDNGMMLPTGDPKNAPEKLARLYRAGYDAIHDVFPEGTYSIIHLGGGWRLEKTLAYLADVVKYGGAFDMFATSYYPYWTAKSEGDVVSRPEMHDMMKAACKACFEEVSRIYNVPTMIVEIGGVDEEEDENYRVLREMVEYADDESNTCQGVFWWEPQGFRDYSNYVLSAWNNDGTPTRAMLGFARN